MTIGSIVIKNDPVKEPETFLLNLAPVMTRGWAMARFSDYKPTDRAEGWYWGASFTVRAHENVLKELFENGLGRHVEVWGYGLEPDFEARITEIVFTLPPDRFIISLRNMANTAFMRADTDDDGVVERSTSLSNAESVALYGTVEGVLSGGELASSAVADQAIQSLIDLRALPKPSADFGTVRDAEPKIEIFCRGYVTTLEDRLYNQTVATGTQSMSSQVKDVLDSVGDFIDTQQRGANTTAVSKEYDIDRKALDIILDIVRLGDGANNRWLFGVKGRDVTGVHGRIAVLSQASPVQTPPTE